ncbi:energy transducer TonB [Rhodoferax sp.]|uniref:energy transducer TonB n=1 Tax=Rhodoferax sp. TaxID=50421 RepID=UPI0025DA44B6|nr:energy transducer TonB [Rhodoferax sp.]
MNSTLSIPPPFTPPPRFSRNAVIVGSVLLFHGAGLWALQSGLVRQAVEIIVPIEMLAQMVEPPKPKPPPPAPPVPVKQQVVKTKAPTPPPAPRPMAIADPTPTPNAPTGVTTPQPPAPPIAEPVAVAPAAPPVAPPAPPRVVLPSSDADYLNNPKPSYPAMSKRLGEQGKVLVRVFIGIDGHPEKAELKRSSGYERLDKSALEYIMKCRFVAGKVNGVPQPMWYEAPVNYVLE